MTDAIKLWDRAMFFFLLVLIIFVPYSAAVTEGCLLIIILAWLIKRFLTWKSYPNQTLFFSSKFSFINPAVPLTIIGLLILVTIPWSHAPALTLKKFFSRFLQQVFLMYAIVEIVRSPKRLYRVLVFLMWTLLVVTVDVMLQYTLGHSFIFHKHTLLFQRVSGSMRHPNDLGTLLVTVLPVTITLILTRGFWMPLLFKKRFLVLLNLLGGILLFLILVSLGLTFSRGAWVAFIVTMIGGCIFLKKYWWTAIVVVLLSTFFWFFGVYFTNMRTDIFPKDSIEQNNIQFLNPSQRIEYWQTAIEVIRRFPWFGCGYNTYIQTLQQLGMTPVEYPHNSLLHIATELGIFGLLMYLWFFLALFLRGMEILKTISFHHDLYLLGTGIFFGIIAWLIHSLLDTPWESLQLSLLWWFFIGLLMSLEKVGQELKASRRD